MQSNPIQSNQFHNLVCPNMQSPAHPLVRHLSVSFSASWAKHRGASKVPIFPCYLPYKKLPILCLLVFAEFYHCYVPSNPELNPS